MSARYSKHTVYCPECEADVVVRFYPGCPAVIGGPPDNWCDADPSEIDAPLYCESCGIEFDDAITDKWLMNIEDELRESEWEGEERDYSDDCYED